MRWSASSRRAGPTSGPDLFRAGGGLADFTAAPFDAAEDLVGDPAGDLVVLFAGNQFMAVPDLVAGFLEAQPSVRSLFYETLPPGVLVEQFDKGGLRMGRLELRVRPDVIALSPGTLDQLGADGRVGPARVYASNDLALLVAGGNPLGVEVWADLGRPGVRVAFPDPAREGIGRLAMDALEAAGGPALRRVVEVDKAASGEVVFTTIHHRQSPSWLAEGAIDVAVVWATEARHQRAVGAPLATVAIPEGQNQRGKYAAAVVAGAPHPRAATAFVNHLCGPAGRAVYESFGFSVP